MALELTGRINKIFPEVSGQGKTGNSWIKQEFLIETQDQFPKKVLVAAWGNVIDTLRQFSEGQEVKVSINLESREYNQRYYTDVKAWRIEASNGGGNSGGSNYSKPASSNSYGNQSSPNVVEAPAPQADDLPF